MGSFCTNITLIGTDPATVEPLLTGMGRVAFLGGWGGHTVVFDELGEAQDGSHAALAQELSASLGCVALASLNHDDDILYLQAFRSGDVRGEYNSRPDYFGEMDEPVELGLVEADGATGPGDRAIGGERWSLGLDPGTLVDLVGVGDAERLAALTATDAVFASDLHAAIAAELGLPTAACGFGYRYLANGDRPDDDGDGGLREVGRPA